MAEYQETLEQGVVSFSGTGDNTIIAAPTGGRYLAIDFLQMVPSADVSLTLKSGSTAISGIVPYKANQANTIENSMGNEHGVVTCEPNSAFVIGSTGSSTITGFIRYRIIGK